MDFLNQLEQSVPVWAWLLIVAAYGCAAGWVGWLWRGARERRSKLIVANLTRYVEAKRDGLGRYAGGAR